MSKLYLIQRRRLLIVGAVSYEIVTVIRGELFEQHGIDLHKNNSL